MAVPIVDTRHWPMVVSTLPERVDEETLQLLVEGHDEVFARRERFAHIGDLRSLNALPAATIRRQLAEWTKRIELDSARYNVGSALVIPSSIVRGGLTALTWLNEPVSPQYYGATTAECHAWCIARLEEAGVPISPEARELGVLIRLGRV